MIEGKKGLYRIDGVPPLRKDIDLSPEAFTASYKLASARQPRLPLSS